MARLQPLLLHITDCIYTAAVLSCRSAAAGCLIGHLPTALLGSILAISLPPQPCTCTVTLMQQEDDEPNGNQHNG